MEGLPKITRTVRVPVTISVHPYMMDHCVNGRGVLAAVEAMEALAASVRGIRPDVDVTRPRDVRFDKFLYLPTDATSISGFNEISFFEDGDVTARLLTKTKAPKATISRTKEHARLSFSKGSIKCSEPPSLPLSYPESGIIEIPAEEIYKHLVPFGPSYQNLVDVLHLFKQGAVGTIHAPSGFVNNDGPGLLGSPFPLDAAFHAACAWGRQFSGNTAFPVGFDGRVIFKKTRPGETYFVRVVPVDQNSDELVFKIWIFDSQKNLMESLSGLRMREVSFL
jgi:hypothetical protein